MPKFEKLCVITKQTPLEELKARYGTKDQARFVLEGNNVPFDGYERFDGIYQQTKAAVLAGVPADMRVSVVDFSFLPTYQFDPGALILTIGPDGLVANTAKYLAGQPIIAVNPDPQTIDGVLAGSTAAQALNLVRGARQPKEELLAMAQARLADGQILYAVNDLFIGQRTHVSARYEIRFKNSGEMQSSSGIIVSTGAGSTGWRRSVLTGASAIVYAEIADQNALGAAQSYAFDRTDRKLAFAVREPFISRASFATIVAGLVGSDEHLIVSSQMPQNGVIFSDGVESDYLEFNSGAVASIGVSERSIRLWSVA